MGCLILSYGGYQPLAKWSVVISRALCGLLALLCNLSMEYERENSTYQ